MYGDSSQNFASNLELFVRVHNLFFVKFVIIIKISSFFVSFIEKQKCFKKKFVTSNFPRLHHQQTPSLDRKQVKKKVPFLYTQRNSQKQFPTFSGSMYSKVSIYRMASDSALFVSKFILVLKPPYCF